MQSGYDCEFVAALPDEIQAKCSICLLVLCEPHMISCCGHSFCKGCLKGALRASKACPLCKHTKHNCIPNKSLERTLNEKVVYCSNKTNGCEWTGKLCQLQSHLQDPGSPESKRKQKWLNTEQRTQKRSVKPTATSGVKVEAACNIPDTEQEAQTLKNKKEASNFCQFVEVRCEYTGCSVKVLRKEMKEHLEACPYKPILCKYCNQTTTLKEVDKVHLPVCPKIPIPCPNECGSRIVREKVAVHVQKKCVLTKIPCKYSHAGCSFVVPRNEMKSMATHMEGNMADHLSLMDKAYSVLEQKIVQQQKSNTTKTKEASAVIDSLKSKCYQQSSEIRRLQSQQSSRLGSKNTPTTSSDDGPGWGGVALGGLLGLAVGAVGAAALMSSDKNDEDSD